MTPNTISTDQWLVAAKHRRSVYNLTGTSSVPDSRIEDILQQVLSFAPSSYNTQPIRLTLITGEKHKQFWDTIIKTAEPILKGVGEGIWNTMGGLMESQKAAYGSVRALVHLSHVCRLIQARCRLLHNLDFFTLIQLMPIFVS
jgi:predicted oxidoreductase (fatty acid repression mutant protein)